MDFIETLVVISVVMSALSLLLMPFAIGKSRGIYTQAHLIGNAIELGILSLFCLRILGKI